MKTYFFTFGSNRCENGYVAIEAKSIKEYAKKAYNLEVMVISSDVEIEILRKMK